MDDNKKGLTGKSQATNNNIMRIGLLSDTHIPDDAKILPPEVLEAFQGVDLILHAGDIYTLSVLDELEQVAPVLAALGDDDYLDTLKDERVKEKHVLEFGGQTLWLVHERPYYLRTQWWEDKVASGEGEYETPDIVVYGHDHSTLVRQLDGVFYVCSGSPTFLNYRQELGTVAIFNINSHGAREEDVSIVQL
ncbi:YfcE family phosphodiesterase [Thermodesulfobacteriota bacterium]